MTGREKDDEWTWDIFKQWPEDCQWVFLDPRTITGGNNASGIEGNHIHRRGVEIDACHFCA
jgi:hypothetical protein